jgi:hypothetical protein
MGRGVQGAAGRALLEAAVVLERAVASKRAVARWQGRRNAALRAAGRLGVPVETLAARLGLSERWVRKVVHARKAAASREASAERAPTEPTTAEGASAEETPAPEGSAGRAA